MKKLRYIFAAISLLMYSCTTDVDTIFDEPTSERLSAKMEECKTLLASAPNGWLIEYFPSYTQGYGGYNFVAEFNPNGEVTVASEIASTVGMDISQTATSHYSLNSSSSVVLTFDTYNRLLHYLSDPDYWAGNEFGGEFEFAYVSGDAEKMVFRGVKTQNEIVFTALESGKNMVDYVKEIMSIRNSVEGQFYCEYEWADSSGNTVNLSNDDSYNTMRYVTNDATSLNKTISYIYTTTGIKFYEPVMFNGVTAQHFSWNNSQKAYVSVDATDATGVATTVTISAYRSDTYVSYSSLSGSWKLYVEGGGSYANVVLIPKVTGVSFTMSGLGLDVEVKYNKYGKYISILSQPVSGDYVYLCAWDAYKGNFIWDTTVGIEFVYNPKSSSRELIARDNGMWGSNSADSFLFVDLEPYVNGGSFIVLAQIPLITKLAK